MQLPMSKKRIIFLLLVLLAAGTAVYFMAPKKIRQPSQEKISVGGHIFETEIADTDLKRAQGLSGRMSLCPDCAMLFVFPEASIRTFWMKDMKFNLDIIWLNEGQIVQIDKNVSREKGEREMISSRVPVDQVLQINSSRAKALGLEINDRLEYFK